MDETISEKRMRGWKTRREKYGVRGHSRELERIIAAAVRQYGLIVSLPQPARHGDILKPLHIGTDIIAQSDDQGFLTSLGRFVGRLEAVDIAKAAGQIKEPQWPPYLYSEDMW